MPLRLREIMTSTDHGATWVRAWLLFGGNIALAEVFNLEDFMSAVREGHFQSVILEPLPPAMD